MSDKLYQYKKFYIDGSVVWKRVQYTGGPADAVFPDTPEGTKNRGSSAKVDHLLSTQAYAETIIKLRTLLEVMGYRDILVRTKWTPTGGAVVLVTLTYPLSPSVAETLQMEFTEKGFREWTSLPMQPKPEQYKLTGVGDRTPLNPLMGAILASIESTDTDYKRKMDID